METKPKIKVRDSNIELLRLVLMLSVVLLHLFGAQIRNIYDNKILFHAELLGIGFTIMSVNAFVFISGYYGIRFRLKSLIKLILQVLFYSVSIYFLGTLILGHDLSIRDVVKNALPVSSGLWWFISSYIALYVVSPILNIGFDGLPREQIKWMVIGLLFLNCFSSFLFNNRALGADGYSFFSLMSIYCLARYMKIYSISFKFPLIIYLGSSVMIFALNSIVCSFSNDVVFPASRYTNPLVVLSAIAVFYVFLKMKPFYSRAVNKAAGYSLAVYLIHTHPIVFSQLKKLVAHIHDSYGNISVVFYLVLIGILIFLVCLFIESIRSFLFKPIYAYLDKVRQI